MLLNISSSLQCFNAPQNQSVSKAQIHTTKMPLILHCVIMSGILQCCNVPKGESDTKPLIVTL